MLELGYEKTAFLKETLTPDPLSETASHVARVVHKVTVWLRITWNLRLFCLYILCIPGLCVVSVVLGIEHRDFCTPRKYSIQLRKTSFFFREKSAPITHFL